MQGISMKTLFCFLVVLLILFSAANGEPCLSVQGSFEYEDSVYPFTLSIKTKNQDSVLTSSFTPGYAGVFHSNTVAFVSAFADFLITDVPMGTKLRAVMKSLMEQNKTARQEGLYSGELYRKANEKETCAVSLEDCLIWMQDNPQAGTDPSITSSIAENLRRIFPETERVRLDLCSLDGGVCYSIQLALDKQIICTGEINLINPECIEMLYEYCINGRYYFNRITLKTGLDKREVSSAVFSSQSASFSNTTLQNRILEERITIIPKEDRHYDFLYRLESAQNPTPLLFSGEITSDESGIRLSGSAYIQPQNGLSFRMEAELSNEDPETPDPANPVALDLSDEKPNAEFKMLFLSGMITDLVYILPEIPDEYMHIIYNLLTK